MRRREYYWSILDDAEKNQIDNLRTDQVEAVYAAIPKKLISQWWIWRDGFDVWKPFTDFPQLIISLRKTEDHFVTPPPFANTPRPEAAVDVPDDIEEPEINFGSLSSSKTEASLGISRKEEKRDRIHNTVSQQGGSVMKRKNEPVSAPLALANDKSGPKRIRKETAKQSENLAHDNITYEDENSVVLTIDKTGQGDGRDNFRFDRRLDIRLVAGDKVYKNTTVNISLKGMQLLADLPKGLPRYFNIEIQQGGKTIPVVCTEVKNRDGSPSNRVKIEVNDYTSGLLAMLLAG